MIAIRRSLVLALVGLLLPSIALAAPAAKMQHAVLHVPAALKTDMHFKHVMASATLTPTKTGITVNLTTNNLPAPATLKSKYYVLWVTNGSKKESLGSLAMHGMMAGIKASTMWHTVQDLTVTAEQSARPMHPMGRVVLSGMVG